MDTLQVQQYIWVFTCSRTLIYASMLLVGMWDTNMHPLEADPLTQVAKEYAASYMYNIQAIF